MQTWLRHEHGGNRRDPRRSWLIKKFVAKRANDGGNGGLHGKNDGFKVARWYSQILFVNLRARRFGVKMKSVAIRRSFADSLPPQYHEKNNPP
jgi:hypothetical protein